MTPLSPKRDGKINVKTLAKSLFEGKTKVQSGIDAGSKANSPSAVIHIVNDKMETEEFKKEAKPFIDMLKSESNRAMSALMEKDPKHIDYDKLTGSVEKLKKLEQLLTGGVTQRHEVKIEELKEFLGKA